MFMRALLRCSSHASGSNERRATAWLFLTELAPESIARKMSVTDTCSTPLMRQRRAERMARTIVRALLRRSVAKTACDLVIGLVARARASDWLVGRLVERVYGLGWSIKNHVARV